MTTQSVGYSLIQQHKYFWHMIQGTLTLFLKLCFNLVFQVKPLLQVTKQEEKLSAKEDELRQVREKMEKAEVEVSELEKKLQQVKLNFN